MPLPARGTLLAAARPQPAATPAATPAPSTLGWVGALLTDKQWNTSDRWAVLRTPDGPFCTPRVSAITFQAAEKGGGDSGVLGAQPMHALPSLGAACEGVLAEPTCGVQKGPPGASPVQGDEGWALHWPLAVARGPPAHSSCLPRLAARCLIHRLQELRVASGIHPPGSQMGGQSPRGGEGEAGREGGGLQRRRRRRRLGVWFGKKMGGGGRGGKAGLMVQGVEDLAGHVSDGRENRCGHAQPTWLPFLIQAQVL